VVCVWFVFITTFLFLSSFPATSIHICGTVSWYTHDPATRSVLLFYLHVYYSIIPAYVYLTPVDGSIFGPLF